MSTNYSFGNRFSYPEADGVGSGISFSTAQELEDADLEAVSPELATMAQMVRDYSVLLNRTRTLEIFNVITKQSDPKIALKLAGAKDKNTNNNVFSGLDEIQTLMFGDPNRAAGAINQNKLNMTLFSDGIRRASAALTAATLLAKLPEVQREYASELRADAIADIDRIVVTYQRSEASTGGGSTAKDEDKPPVAFYFVPADFELPNDRELVLEWYCPSFTTAWSVVQTYRGSVSTWHLVSDLADCINQYTIQSVDGALLAIAELGGRDVVNEGKCHALSFYPRRPINGVVGHSINVRIQTKPITTPDTEQLVIGATKTDPSGSVFGKPPFRWGTSPESLQDYPVNGSIIILYFNRASSLNAKQLNEAYTPIVLYFRNKKVYEEGDAPPLQMTEFAYRLQPWQPNLSEVDEEPVLLEETFDRIMDGSGDATEQLNLDNSRFSQIALQLLEGLARINLKTKATGAIIRNDPTEVAQPMSAVELVGWSLTKSMSHITMDIIKVPPDIEIATGDYVGPRTPFSSKPRSLVISVKSRSYFQELGAMAANETVKLVSRKPNNLWRAIVDEHESVQDFRL
jgi:hypothetical protein